MNRRKQRMSWMAITLAAAGCGVDGPQDDDGKESSLRNPGRHDAGPSANEDDSISNDGDTCVSEIPAGGIQSGRDTVIGNNCPPKRDEAPNGGPGTPAASPDAGAVAAEEEPVAGPSSGSVTTVINGRGSADAVRGDGNLVSTPLTLSTFTGLELSDHYAAEISVGAQSVTLNLDANVLPYVEAAVLDDLLGIGDKAGSPQVIPSQNARVVVVAPSLQLLSTSGVARIHGTAKAGNATLSATGSSAIEVTLEGTSDVDASATGSSTIQLAGVADNLVVSATGSARVASDLPTATAEVFATGSSKVTVHATKSVSVSATGSSVVTVIGDPAERDVDTTGSARVVFEN
jgi:hypothetical protein